MTTTLRPSGPEERPDGDRHAAPRRRPYDICVNGRRVGAVQLAAADEYGVLTGRITGLEVDAADRRRGRATVAALAAEEVLRGWGCRRVTIAVPAAAEPAVRLATALGFTERSRHLVKRLDTDRTPGSDDAETSGVRPMTDEHFRAWLARDHAGLVDRLTADGVRPDRAVQEAHRAQRALLPDGPATTGMAFRRLLEDGTGVGTLWLRLDGAPRSDADAWVYAVEVSAQHRGRGHGHTLMRAAEQLSRQAALRAIGLNVHAGNRPAHALYASCGYLPAELHLAKPLF